MAFVFVTSVAHAQNAPVREHRFAVAAGATTPGVHMPRDASGSLSARLLPNAGRRFQLQADAMVIGHRLSGFDGIASVEAVSYHKIRGRSVYGLLGVGMTSNKGLLAGGFGTEFAMLGRLTFAEFRMYGPEIHDFNGFRIGTRF